MQRNTAAFYQYVSLWGESPTQNDTYAAIDVSRQQGGEDPGQVPSVSVDLDDAMSPATEHFAAL